MALQAPLTLLQPLRPRPTLQRLVQDQGNALTHLWEGDRRGPCFSPARFPVLGTTWPGTTAFDEVATPSNGAPHSRPNPLHSYSAGDMLRCDVPLWLPGPSPPGASRVQRWTDHHPPAPPAPGRVTVAAAYQRLRGALVTPMGSRDHASLPRFHHQRTFTAIAHLDPVPGWLRQRLAPGLDVLPGTRGTAPRAARRWRRDLQITHRRVRRHGQQVLLTQGR
jgi:hypothetical protein